MYKALNIKIIWWFLFTNFTCICTYTMFQRLVTALKYLAGCLTHWPQRLPLPSDYSPCCMSQGPGPGGDQTRSSKGKAIPPLTALSPPPRPSAGILGPMGALEKVGQPAGVGMGGEEGDRHSAWAFPSWINQRPKKTKQNKKTHNYFHISSSSPCRNIKFCVWSHINWGEIRQKITHIHNILQNETFC